MSVKVIRIGETANQETATILVFERTKLAKIDWDFFRFHEANDEYFRDNAERLTREVLDIYRSYATPKSSFAGDGLVGHMEDMPIATAQHVGWMLSNLFDHFVKGRPTVATGT